MKGRASLFQSATPSHPLNFSGLLSFCNELNPINEEFSKIPQVSVKIDELPPGAELKNRYANVIPLPETRVPLERLNNDAMTEYINASYVRVSETFRSSSDLDRMCHEGALCHPTRRRDSALSRYLRETRDDGN